MGYSVQDLKIVTVQAAATIHATETVMGGEIDVSGYSQVGIFVTYAQDTETSVAIIPKFLTATGGTEHPDCSWSGAAGVRTVTADSYSMSASGSHFILLDVKNHALMKLYEDATGGTTLGTVAVSYTLWK